MHNTGVFYDIPHNANVHLAGNVTTSDFAPYQTLPPFNTQKTGIKSNNVSPATSSLDFWALLNQAPTRRAPGTRNVDLTEFFALPADMIRKSPTESFRETSRAENNHQVLQRNASLHGVSGQSQIKSQVTMDAMKSEFSRVNDTKTFSMRKVTNDGNSNQTKLAPLKSPVSPADLLAPSESSEESEVSSISHTSSFSDSPSRATETLEKQPLEILGLHETAQSLPQLDYSTDVSVQPVIMTKKRKAAEDCVPAFLVENIDSSRKFCAALYRYWKKRDRGHRPNYMPTVNGYVIDLFTLFKAVINAGGSHSLPKSRPWQTVLSRVSAISLSELERIKRSITRTYHKFLAPLEDEYMALGRKLPFDFGFNDSTGEFEEATSPSVVSVIKESSTPTFLHPDPVKERNPHVINNAHEDHASSTLHAHETANMIARSSADLFPDEIHLQFGPGTSNDDDPESPPLALQNVPPSRAIRRSKPSRHNVLNTVTRQCQKHLSFDGLIPSEFDTIKLDMLFEQGSGPINLSLELDRILADIDKNPPWGNS